MAHYDGAIRINTKLNTQPFNTGMKSMTASLGKFAAAVGVAFSVAALVKMGKQAIDLASDIAEVDNVVSKSFGNMRAEMDALANTAIEKLGMSRLTAYQTGSTFMAMGKSMVDSTEDAKNMALALTELTGNMSSFYNVTQDIASTALKSIYTGETETLKQFGVVMTETNLQQFAYEQGIRKTMAAMTQSEKVMLRYKYVQEQLSFIGNDFLDTQDGWANQTRILSEQWTELLSILGSGLVTVLTPVVKTLNSIVTSLINIANAAGKVLSELFGIQAQKLSVNASSATEAADAMTAYGDATEEAAKKAKNSVAAFDDLNVLQQKSGADSVNSGGGLSDVGTGIDTEEMQASVGVVDKLQLKLEKLLKDISPFTSAVKQLWDEGLSKLVNFTATGFTDFYENFLVPLGTWAFGTDDKGFTRLVKIINEDLSEIDWSAINKNLKDFWAAIEPYAEAFGEGLIDFLEDLGNVSVSVINSLFGEDGPMEDITDWLNDNDPETVRSLGYAFGQIVTALLLFRIAKPGISILLILLDKLKTSAIGGATLTGLGTLILNLKNLALLNWPAIASGIGNVLNIVNPGLLGELFARFEDNVLRGTIFDTSTWEGLPGLLNKGIEKAIEGIGKIVFTNFFDAIIDTFQLNIDLFDGATYWFDKLIEDFKECKWSEIGIDLLNGILGGILAAFSIIGSPFIALFNWIYKGICDVFGIHSPAKEMEPLGEYILRGIIEGFEGEIGGFTESITNWFDESVKPWFTFEKWDGIFDGVRNAFSNLWNFIFSIGSSILGVTDSIAEGASSLGVTKTGNTSLKSGKSIPHLATGAVIPPNQQFMAILGDQTQGTNIEAPSSLIKQMVKEGLAEMGGVGSGVTTIKFEGDMAELVRVLKPYIAKENIRTGNSLLVGRSMA